MQTVNGIGDANFGLEEFVDLSGIGQVGLDGDCLCAFRDFRLNDVGKDEADIGSPGVSE